jgi:hypothetical protein
MSEIGRALRHIWYYLSVWDNPCVWPRRGPSLCLVGGLTLVTLNYMRIEKLFTTVQDRKLYQRRCFTGRRAPG